VVPSSSAAAASSATGSLGKARVLAAVALFGFAFLLYAPSLDDYFLGDDFDLVVSFYGQPPSYFLELLWGNESGDVWKDWGIDPESGRGYLRPLKIWLMGLDLLVWGANPFGFHLTANALFALDVVLVFLILDSLFPDRRHLALLGAGTTAMHPIFAEIVPFVTAREETLALLFVLAAFHAFVGFRERARSPLAFHVFFALGLLSKESAITALPLVVGWDLVHGRLWPRRAEEWRRALRLYAPTLAILLIYFSLRFIAFGNFKGGDSGETEYLSPAAFLSFHPRFLASLIQQDLFAFAGVPGMGWLAGAALGAGLVAVALRGIARRRWLDLLFFGPVWYLASMSVFYGTHFSNRHHPLLVIGLVVFATLLLGELTRGLGRALDRTAAAAALLACALAFLPPTLSTTQSFGAASETVRAIRAQIELQTVHLPDGSSVLITNVPQQTSPPWYFGWGFLSALKRPFTESDLANRVVVVNPRNLTLTRSRTPVPEHFDLRVEIR
jgi:hypothetical protein